MLASLDRVVLALTTPLAAIALLRITPGLTGHPFDAIEAFTGWALAPAWLALVYALARRAHAVALLASPAALVHAMLVATLFTAGAARAEDDALVLRVATANLYAGNPRAEVLADELAALEVDVLALEEVTPRWREVLGERGVLARFPHRVIADRDDCFGIALLSRVPMDATIEDLDGVPMIDARLTTRTGPVRVLAVHTMPPLGIEATTWNAQLALLARIVSSSREPVVVTGDLNASPFGRGYRTLLDAGLRGAHESTGRGLATTWPNGTRLLPPMRLDHVLVSREIDARDVREGQGEGSDHRPVIATLALH
ncbi:endonuclease/exonuclease/phosphatase family protein [Sandaracinus amylolyticus]|uniref:endonuclease/exonuclease/phosphatase family protein n=1 Tax=Sandaracinus amylolyticus TaxID=927083 RepID=UPI001F4212D5|nr:endonuclease/exonuclease/phosphatase family protein [Sandaracinus amylolyticus]UJR78268.1 Endo/exonuclease/phosphatase domain-containing protein [Sandaracinus amylolyticus]